MHGTTGTRSERCSRQDAFQSLGHSIGLMPFRRLDDDGQFRQPLPADHLRLKLRKPGDGEGHLLNRAGEDIDATDHEHVVGPAEDAAL